MAPSHPRSPYAVEFDGVGIHYRTQKKPSVADVSFHVNWGETVVIVGASGSGKSTLVHALNGLIPHRYEAQVAGTIRVGGVDASELDPSASPLVATSRRVGTVLQNTDAQFVGLTVAEDIAFSLENHEVATPQMPARIREVAERLGLTELLDSSPHDLSGGQKQRVAVAGVLVDDVPILLFDEPLASLDPSTGRAMIELAHTLKTEHGATIIMVEHRLEEVLHRPVDRILLMHKGRLVANATPAELLCSPLLAEHGIRMPLHLAALEAAGVHIEPSNTPENASSLHLDSSQRERARAWALEERARQEKGLEGAGASRLPLGSDGTALTPALEVRDLTVRYRRAGTDFTALHGVSVTVGRGEMVAIVGNNGAGKSTLARTITGFERPTSGSVLLGGEDASSMSLAEIGTRVAFVLQDPAQMISAPLIADELALGPRAHGLPEDEVQERVKNALETCGLTPFKTWPVSALSHGQKKRVTIAAALTMDPQVLILDEPTAGQDLGHYTAFMEFLRELNAKGRTILLITHDMHLALEYAPRALVVSAGKILADSTPAAILTDPRLMEAANLAPTALYPLAQQLGFSVPAPHRHDGSMNATQFVETVIAHDRARRDAAKAGESDGE